MGHKRKSSKVFPATKRLKRKGEAISPPGPQFPAERVSQLQQFFQEAVSEGRVDFDKLRTALGVAVDERPERYSFTWAGKRNAILELQRPTWGTLVPARKESVNFDATQNIFIEGENLEVLKLLYKAYFGRVKLIYVDAPYNTGNDFVYPDDFADPKEAYLRLTGQKDAAGNLLTSNPESSGRYHSAWLSMMYPRLFLARQLLRDDGVIFVSIDDHEVHNLRLLMNEIFGEENFVAELIWQKMDSPSRNAADRIISEYHEYILVYAKGKQVMGLSKEERVSILDAYPLRLPDGRKARRRQMRKNGKGARREDRPTMWYALTAPDRSEVWPIAPEGWEGRWVLSKAEWVKRTAAGLTEWIKREGGWTPYYIEVAPKNPLAPWSTLWTDVDQNRQAKAELTKLLGSQVPFQTPKPVSLIAKILGMAAEEDDIVLDFFSGSGTTGHAVMETNSKDGGSRRFIMVQLQEPTGNKEFPTISEISKERIRRVSKLLSKESAGKAKRHENGDQDLGFAAFRLVPSNFKPWLGTDATKPDEFTRTMELFADPLADGWKPEPVIYEVALREGFGLTARLEKLSGLKGNTVWRVTDADKGQSFRICLDDSLQPATVKALALQKDDLFICRDVALTDKLAANLALQCRLKTI